MIDSIENFSFFKYLALIITPGSFAVREKLKKKRSDQRLTLKDFLNQRKHEIYHLYKRELCCLCQPQANSQHGRGLRNKDWNLLFEDTKQKCKNRNKTCCCYFTASHRREEDFDITLVVCLLINLFSLPDEEKKNLEELREHRNFIAHARNAHIEDRKYVKRFNTASSVIEDIAQSCGDNIHKFVCGRIRDIMDSSLLNICHKEIVSWDSDKKITLERFEEAMEAFEDVMKQGKETPEKTTAGDQMEKDNKLSPEKCAAKLRKKLKEIKGGNTVHVCSHRRSQRPSVPQRKDSKSLPSTLKKSECQKVSANWNARNEPLKKDEIDFLSEVMRKCRTESLEEVEELLKDFSVNGKLFRGMDKKGYRAVHYTAERNDDDLIRIINLLLDHGAEIDDQTSEGMTILHIACKNGNVQLVEYCLSKDSSLLNMEDNFGFNPALFAVFYGHMAVFHILRGERDLNIKSRKTSMNILHLACLSGKMDTFSNILNNYPGIKRDNDIEERNILHYVARGGKIEILDFLLKDAWALEKLEQDSRNTGSILHTACLYGHVEMCRILISKYPNMLHVRDSEGLHAMHYAAVGGNPEVMRLLKGILNKMTEEYVEFSVEERKIDILRLACVYRKNEMWKFIAGEFPNLIVRRDNDGWCMTHVAARCNNWEVLEMILAPAGRASQNNCMLGWNEKDNLKRTALHIGGLYGHLNVCKYMIRTFPQIITERDVDGCLACTLAAYGGNFEVFCLLFDLSTEIINNDDVTNISKAARQSINPNMMKLITEKYTDLQLGEQVLQTNINVDDIHLNV